MSFSDSALARAVSPSGATFRDGLGERLTVLDKTGGETFEVLALQPELTAVPSFEFALRERVGRLANFRHAYYARVRRVDRLPDRPGLAIVSEHTAGARLSEILAVAERERLALDVNAALCLIRQLVPAVAMLHQNARDVSHGALAPERIVVTPHARLVIVEYVLGSALEQLQFSHERLWKEFRVAMPSSAGLPRFDHRADVNQIGIIALSLIMGRPLRQHEYPNGIADVLASACEISALGGREPLAPALRTWLARALQVDVRHAFHSALEAQAALDEVLSDESGYIAAPIALETFLARYHECAATAFTAAPPAPAPVETPPRPRPQMPQAPSVFAPPLSHPVATSLKPEMPRASQNDMSPLESIDRALAEQTGAHGIPRSFEAPAGPTQSFRIEPVSPQRRDPVDRPTRQAGWEPHLGSLPGARPTPAPPVGPLDPARGEPLDAARDRGAGWGAPRSADLATPRTGLDPDRLFKHDLAEPPPTPAVSARAEPAAAPEREDDPHLHDQPRSGSRRLRRAAVLLLTAIALTGAGIIAALRWTNPSALPSGNGTLVIESRPVGAQVVVDGEARGVTPLRLSLSAGAHIVELRASGEPRVIPLTITAGGQVSQYIELQGAPPQAGGNLQVRTDPAGARVTVDGQLRGVAPLTVSDLSAGEHEVVLDSDLGSTRQTVVIEAGATASLVVPLSSPSAPLTGWVAVSAPVEVQLYEGGRLLGTSQTERIMVGAGRHELEIVNETLAYRATRVVQVPAGKVAPVKIDLPKGTIHLNALPWAEVWIDGEKVGDTPIGNLSVTIGPHEIVFRHPQLGEQRHAATVTLAAPARLSVDLRK